MRGIIETATERTFYHSTFPGLEPAHYRGMQTCSSLEPLEARIAPASLALGTGTTMASDPSFTAMDTVSATIDPVGSSGKLVATGTVTLGDAILDLTLASTPANNATFTLIDNDDSLDAVNGTFAGLPERAIFKVGSTYFQITYMGGDGNDVEVTALIPQVRITGGGKIAQYTDADGDFVTFRTNKGTFTQDSFVLVPQGGLSDEAQLAELKLDASFTNATITTTVKRDLFKGNGFVNVGHLDATGINLSAVNIRGDLATIDIGDPNGIALAIKTLTVHSLGLLGDSTLETPGTLDSTFSARMGNLVITTDLHGASLTSAKGFGNITIGGSFIQSEIKSGADIGAIVIRHDLLGVAGDESVISAFGQTKAPTKGVDLAIKSLSVAGRVERANITAGFALDGSPLNADASIGAVKVGGTWAASNLTAGTDAGADLLIGTGDDKRFDNAGNLPGFRDNAAIMSQIASITIGGQVLGTTGNKNDTFGFVAEYIRAFAIGGARIPLSVLAHNDFFPLASSGPGAGGRISDVNLVEVLA